MFKRFVEWMDARIPMTKLGTSTWRSTRLKNFNMWYVFGFLATIVLINQILTGVWLTMNYVPSAEGAFASVEYIMRDVEYGWLLRYMHSTGASAFFVVVYLHMFRGMMYGSYQKPRELIWLFGMFIFWCLWQKPSWATCCLGTNVLLGCTGNHFIVWCYSGYR